MGSILGSLFHYSLLENSVERGDLCAAVHGVAESDTTECLNSKTLTPTLVPTFNLPSSETTSINFLGIHPVIFYIYV